MQSYFQGQSFSIYCLSSLKIKRVVSLAVQGKRHVAENEMQIDQKSAIIIRLSFRSGESQTNMNT